jgi:diguanylate cyclase (GGDEF)-like protein
LLALLLCATAPALGPASTFAAAAAGAAQFALPPDPIHPRSLASAAGLITIGLLLLLYGYRRQRYILFWIGGWCGFAASSFVLTPERLSASLGYVLYGSSHLLAIASALFFLFAADAYRPVARLRYRWFWLLMPAAIWLLLAPFAFGERAVFVPGHLLTGAALTAAAGAHFLILRRARLLGASIIGLALLLLAGINLWLALTPGAGPAGADAFLVELALYFVMALGMQLMTFEDMTYELRRTNVQLESAQSELRQMVVTDALTGCRNRRFFDEVIARELGAQRRYGTPLSLMFVDVDHFKRINDSMGHAAGDRVLREVAAFLTRKTREADYVFRWGGDEFLLLLACHEEEAGRRGGELQQEFAAVTSSRDLPEGVGLSFGCAEIRNQTVADALKLADERMYDQRRQVRPAV